MSGMQNPATVPDEGGAFPGAPRFAPRLTGGSLNVETLDPVVALVHDLRSPLASVLLLSGALMREAGGDQTDRQRRQLSLVHRAALALTALLTDAIDVPGDDEGLPATEPVSFSVGEVFRSVADLLGPLAETKNLAFRIAAPAQDARIGYPPALRRVLLNLTTNALKYTEAGYVEISATPKADAGGLVFSVRDTGQGLPPSVIDALGEADGPTAANEGRVCEARTLGLGICRKLVQSMGAQLEFETRPGLGTRFHFTLDLPVTLTA